MSGPPPVPPLTLLLLLLLLRRRGSAAVLCLSCCCGRDIQADTGVMTVNGSHALSTYLDAGSTTDGEQQRHQQQPLAPIKLPSSPSQRQAHHQLPPSSPTAAASPHPVSSSESHLPELPALVVKSRARQRSNPEVELPRSPIAQPREEDMMFSENEADEMRRESLPPTMADDDDDEDKEERPNSAPHAPSGGGGGKSDMRTSIYTHYRLKMHVRA